MPSPAALTLRGRAAAERLMVDTVTIRRRTGQSTSPETGVITVTRTVVYTGKCKVQQRSAHAANTDVGEADILTSQLELHIPMSVDTVAALDEATIDASVLDPDLVGRLFQIRGLAHKSFQTARRFAIEELNA